MDNSTSGEVTTMNATAFALGGTCTKNCLNGLTHMDLPRVREQGKNPWIPSSFSNAFLIGLSCSHHFGSAPDATILFQVPTGNLINGTTGLDSTICKELVDCSLGKTARYFRLEDTPMGLFVCWVPKTQMYILQQIIFFLVKHAHTQKLERRFKIVVHKQIILKQSIFGIMS